MLYASQNVTSPHREDTPQQVNMRPRTRGADDSFLAEDFTCLAPKLFRDSTSFVSPVDVRDFVSFPWWRVLLRQGNLLFTLERGRKEKGLRW